MLFLAEKKKDIKLIDGLFWELQIKRLFYFEVFFCSPLVLYALWKDT